MPSERWPVLATVALCYTTASCDTVRTSWLGPWEAEVAEHARLVAGEPRYGGDALHDDRPGEGAVVELSSVYGKSYIMSDTEVFEYLVLELPGPLITPGTWHAKDLPAFHGRVPYGPARETPFVTGTVTITDVTDTDATLILDLRTWDKQPDGSPAQDLHLDGEITAERTQLPSWMVP